MEGDTDFFSELNVVLQDAYDREVRASKFMENLHRNSRWRESPNEKEFLIILQNVIDDSFTTDVDDIDLLRAGLEGLLLSFIDWTEHAPVSSKLMEAYSAIDDALYED